MTVPQFETQFLNDYMQMVEDTESPRLYHVWSALAGVSGALGRRCWFPFGPFTIYTNQFVLLVGNPATRKSSAISIAKRIIKQSTGVRFAPHDTAGQRQGLISAIRGAQDEELQKEYIGAVDMAAQDTTLLTLGDIARSTNKPEEDDESFQKWEEQKLDKHHIMVAASEFTRLIGQNNTGLIEFLTDLWDGDDDIEYQTKDNVIRIKNPLMNILGATTPTSLNLALPAGSNGSGFLSRVILVYGARKYKMIPRPVTPEIETVGRVKEALSRVYLECNGAFSETPDAKAYCESQYGKPLDITDSRFGYYMERRQDHLIKTAMTLAASRGDQTITKTDYQEANRILRATERGMPDALGEFGLNPLASLKQSMLETLKSLQGPIDIRTFRDMFHRDGRVTEIGEAFNEIAKMPQVLMTQLDNGVNFVSYKPDIESVGDSLIKALAEG